MTIQPAVPLSGMAGLRYIDATYDNQRAGFANAGQMARDLDAFRTRVSGIRTAADLVADPPVLRVVLGAFGLEEEAPKRAFIRQIIESDPFDRESLAGRLVDPRFARLSETLGFFPGGRPRLDSPVLIERLAEDFVTRQFEKAVGAINEPLRLAMNFRREMGEIATRAASDTSGWLQALGRPPVRAVLQRALGLPDGAMQLPLDRLTPLIADRANAILGAEGLRALARPEAMERFVDRYLVQADASLARPGGAAPALQILSAGLGPNSAAGLFSILLSRP
ncbi:MAG: DUF1217 domain-containing protein [Rubricella sp.]